MKTVFKSYDTFVQCDKKRKQLNSETGLRWTYYTTGNGAIFCPAIDKDTVPSKMWGMRLHKYLTKEYQNFVGLADKSGIPLLHVLEGAKYLAQSGFAVPTANRATTFGAIKLG